MADQPHTWRRPGWAALLLAALLLAAGCGGEFWGGVGDWEPGELGACPVQRGKYVKNQDKPVKNNVRWVSVLND